MLVEPTKNVKASSCSQYLGITPLQLKLGMLGVVKELCNETDVQIEYFDPLTGCIEHCITPDVLEVLWPKTTVDLTKTSPADYSKDVPRYWFCGSINYLAAFEYLKAISILRPSYFVELHPESLRIPGIDKTSMRTHFKDFADLHFPERHAARIALLSILINTQF